MGTKMAKKTCTVCGREYYLNRRYFYRNKAKPDGWESSCRSCKTGKVPRKWTEQAKACFLSHADCQNCYIKKYINLETDCQMAETVKVLLKVVGPPEEREKNERRSRLTK